MGKTTLAKGVCSLLSNSVCVKLGHGREKSKKTGILYPLGTPFAEIANIHEHTKYLIIESNRILREITPDLTIYLGSESPKPSARLAKRKADITRGQRVASDSLVQCAARLGLDIRVMRKIAWLAGARPSPTTAIILSGDNTFPTGTDKARLGYNRLTALESIGQRLLPWFDEILISVSQNGHEDHGMFRTVRDQLSGEGTLRAIYSCLKASQNEINFIMAYDIATLHFPLIFKLLMWSEEHDIVLPSFERGTREPLHAIYHKNIRIAAEELLSQGQGSLDALFERCSFFEFLVEDAT